MQIKVITYQDNGKATLGLLFINGEFFCHTLEDTYRSVKVKGETRVPRGTYKLGLQMTDTPLTLKYRQKHNFFKHHIEIKNVPNYTGVYIHIGNHAGNTDGCLLLGDGANLYGTISSSTLAFKRFYEKIYPMLKAGADITIELN